MKKVLIFSSIAMCILLFLPGIYEFTYRVKYYIFPFMVSLTLIFASPLKISLRKTHLFFFSFLLISLITLPFSYSPSRTIDGFVWIFFVTIFSILISCDWIEEAFIVRSIFWTAFIVSIGGLFQKVIALFKLIPLPKDAYGVPMINFAIGHRNPLSHFLSASLPLVFMFGKGHSLLLLVPIVVSVYLSGSRAGIFALTFSFILSLMVWEEYVIKKRLAILIFFLIVLTFTPQFRRAVVKTMNLSYSPNKVRVMIWKDVFNMPLKRLVSGYGLSSFPSLFPFIWSEETALEITRHYQDQYVEHAHNEFLTVLAESGIIGFLLFLTLFGYLMWQGVKRWSEKKYYFISVVTILLLSIVDSPLRNPACLLLFVVCATFLGDKTNVQLILGRRFALPFLFLSFLILISFYGRVSTTMIYMRFLNGKISERTALKMVEKRMKFSPLFHKGFYYLGNLYSLNGMRGEAERSFKRSISLFKGYYTSSFNLSLLYLREGRLKEFERYIRYTLKLSPYYLKANEIMYLYKMKTGDEKGAMIYYERMKKVQH